MGGTGKDGAVNGKSTAGRNHGHTTSERAGGLKPKHQSTQAATAKQHSKRVFVLNPCNTPHSRSYSSTNNSRVQSSHGHRLHLDQRGRLLKRRVAKSGIDRDREFELKPQRVGRRFSVCLWLFLLFEESGSIKWPVLCFFRSRNNCLRVCEAPRHLVAEGRGDGNRTASRFSRALV